MSAHIPFQPTGQIARKFRQAGLNLKEMLSLIEMTWEDNPQDSPLVPSSHLFADLDRLIRRTVEGSQIKRFQAVGKTQPFQVFEAFTGKGETLGYLNMMYLRKPLPCYYLVYVEVNQTFRGQGLGNRILEAFKEYVESKGALGLLDNIIPEQDPTFDLYTKQGWQSLEELIGNPTGHPAGHYMIYRPASLKTNDLAVKLPKLIFNLQKKRSVLEMQDNEGMVKRTILEFNQIYGALEKLFQEELARNQPTPLMRFMFTKLTTRFLVFRRRIQELLGYTGGESLEQIAFSPQVRNLVIQPSSFNLEANLKVKVLEPSFSPEVLPQHLRQEPTKTIETLPLYMRPYLREWEKKKGQKKPDRLTIGDLLELGFDPTRLRELTLGDQTFMLERVSTGLLTEAELRLALLNRVKRKTDGARIGSARLLVNPPLLWLQDRGNGYILRRKVPGIHAEEALAQLRTHPGLKTLNQELRVDRVIEQAVREIRTWLSAHLRPQGPLGVSELAVFVPWDLEGNRPLVAIDDRLKPYLEHLWVA
ncbi:MAG: GNAT family N-acetyltransferase [Deltaproteobacteria bacterium]|nr:GNAT family N-acetyltransferase [Deltaproteobacteria bacterium]